MTFQTQASFFIQWNKKVSSCCSFPYNENDQNFFGHYKKVSKMTLKHSKVVHATEAIGKLKSHMKRGKNPLFF